MHIMHLIFLWDSIVYTSLINLILRFQLYGKDFLKFQNCFVLLSSIKPRINNSKDFAAQIYGKRLVLVNQEKYRKNDPNQLDFNNYFYLAIQSIITIKQIKNNQ